LVFTDFFVNHITVDIDSWCFDDTFLLELTASAFSLETWISVVNWLISDLMISATAVCTALTSA
jgi:hypothetical protein